MKYFGITTPIVEFYYRAIVFAINAHNKCGAIINLVTFVFWKL